MLNMKESKHYKIFIPNNKFWNAWREHKESMKFQGVGVTKVYGKFYVLVPKDYVLNGFKTSALEEAEDFCC